MKTIKIGLSISLTGDYCVQGVESFEGVKLWVDKINNQGGIFLKDQDKTVPIELIYYDDESSVSKCKSNIQKFILEDKVHILLGPYSSSLGIGVCEVAEEYNKTIWNYGASTDEIEERNFNCVINAITPASNYSHGIIDAIRSADPEAKKIAAFSAEDSGFSTRVANGAKVHGDMNGFQVKEFKFKSGTKNFSNLMEELIDYRPDLILGMGRAEDDLNLAEELFSRNLSVKAIGLVVASIKLFKDKFGHQVERVFSASQWESGIQIEPDVGPTPTEFSMNFESTYHKSPDYVAAQGYNIGLILEKCIQDTGTLDGAILRQYAKELELNTFYGKFKTDKNGNQIGHEMLTVQWQNREKVIVYPEPLAASKIIYPR